MFVLKIRSDDVLLGLEISHCVPVPEGDCIRELLTLIQLRCIFFFPPSHLTNGANTKNYFTHLVCSVDVQKGSVGTLYHPPK